MSYLPQIAPEVLTTASGAACFSCDEKLHPPMGKPCLCDFCWRKTEPNERDGFLVAPREREQSVQAGKAKHRKGKK